MHVQSVRLPLVILFLLHAGTVLGEAPNPTGEEELFIHHATENDRPNPFYSNIAMGFDFMMHTNAAYSSDKYAVANDYYEIRLGLRSRFTLADRVVVNLEIPSSFAFTWETKINPDLYSDDPLWSEEWVTDAGIPGFRVATTFTLLDEVRSPLNLVLQAQILTHTLWSAEDSRPTNVVFGDENLRVGSEFTNVSLGVGVSKSLSKETLVYANAGYIKRYSRDGGWIVADTMDFYPYWISLWQYPVRFYPGAVRFVRAGIGTLLGKNYSINLEYEQARIGDMEVLGYVHELIPGSAESRVGLSLVQNKRNRVSSTFLGVGFTDDPDRESPFFLFLSTLPFGFDIFNIRL